MSPRNIQGIPQPSDCGSGASALSRRDVCEAVGMTASTTFPASPANPPAPWVSVGSAAWAVIAKLKVVHDPRA